MIAFLYTKVKNGDFRAVRWAWETGQPKLVTKRTSYLFEMTEYILNDNPRLANDYLGKREEFKRRLRKHMHRYRRRRLQR